MQTISVSFREYQMWPNPSHPYPWPHEGLEANLSLNPGEKKTVCFVIVFAGLKYLDDNVSNLKNRNILFKIKVEEKLLVSA